jgi:hypothetical protein
VAVPRGALRRWTWWGIRVAALALALLPGRVSSSASVPERHDRSLALAETRACAIANDLLTFEGVAYGDRSDSHLPRGLDKCPDALRKHSRHPSPSDDDGTSKDPTDDDKSSDDFIGNDDTEPAIALWSPPTVCFLIVSEGDCAPLSSPTVTPLYLALQRFRC